MLLKFLETCGVEGEIVSAGEVVELDERLGKSLIAMGRAREATDEDMQGSDDTAKSGKKGK